MFKAIKRRCWRRKFRRNLARGCTGRQACKMHEAASVGIYYSYGELQEWERLLSLLKESWSTGRQVHLLVYAPGPSAPPVPERFPFPVSVMGAEDLDFCQMPKTGKKARLAGFFSRGYDLFIDFSPRFHWVDAGVVSSVKAKMKVGKGDPWGTLANDLILSPREGASYVEAFAESVKTYLSVFK